jgi:hypothetical protein
MADKTIASKTPRDHRIWMEIRSNDFVAAILRDTRLRRAPQDEGFSRGEILDPHGEGARHADTPLPSLERI